MVHADFNETHAYVIKSPIALGLSIWRLPRQ